VSDNFTRSLERWHRPIYFLPYRLLLMGCGFYHVALLMWNPHRYAETIGGFNLMVAMLLIWAICSSMIFGIGFKPRAWLWQVIFSPYISAVLLIVLTSLHLT
jgi:cyd operon protein YbgE